MGKSFNCLKFAEKSYKPLKFEKRGKNGLKKEMKIKNANHPHHTLISPGQLSSHVE